MYCAPVRSLIGCLALVCACTKPPAVADAGTLVERGTDLRSATLAMFPEWRGVQLTKGSAVVTRAIRPAKAGDLESAHAIAEQNGFTGEPLTRPPFMLELSQNGDTLYETLRMQMKEEELGRVLSAPNAMSSESLAHWLPKVGPTESEEFALDIEWVAVKVSRADFLVWQLVDGATRARWTVDALPADWHRPDGGENQLPSELKLTLTNPDNGARIIVDRNGQRAKLRYALRTYERL